jgi:transcriptional regulator with XRE-family HTH domain
MSREKFMLQNNTTKPYDKKIGDRIRELRKAEHLSQKEFALVLGVKGGYISTLETHRNEPSEQLILNICRTFGVLYNWLKYGNGEKYGVSRLTPRGRSIMREIITEVLSPERKLSISELAQVLGIDPHISSNRLNFPESFYSAISYLIQIFREGDPGKIEAILAQLKALRTKPTIEKLKVA